MTKAIKKEKPHYLGHRQRLRHRFLKEPQVIPDYELLEMILYWAYPRVDTKERAKDMLAQYGNLNVMIQKAERGEFSESLNTLFCVFKELMRRTLLEDMQGKVLLNHSQSVLNYCHAMMAYLDVEQFRIFFLDRKYHLICDEVQQKGTIDQVSLYPREVLKRALDVGATCLIMVHNHPTGDPSPSRADIDLTNHLRNSLRPFRIHVLDHFIVGKKGYFSFREQGMITD
jgi:DNA repair protein RadC